jgi:hypothetical protein
VIGHDIGVGFSSSGQGFGGLAVPESAAGRQHTLVKRLSGQCVDEADAGALGFRLEQVPVDGALDNRQQRLLTHSPNIRPEVERHLLPDHGRHR